MVNIIFKCLINIHAATMSSAIFMQEDLGQREHDDAH